MADIKQRISLDGADDVASKLRKIGDTGSDAFKKLKQYSGEAGVGLARHTEGLGDHAEGLEGSSEAGERLREVLHTLHPVASAAGLELGELGAYARLAGAGLAPLGAALTGSVLVALAKLGEETQKAKGRLKALGDEKGFDRLEERARKAGVGVESLQGRYEEYLQATQQANAKRGGGQVVYAPGYQPGEAEEAAAGVEVVNGGKIQTPSSKEAFGKFDSALFAEIRTDVESAEAAKQILGNFERGLNKDGLTGESLRALQESSPSAANFVTKSLQGRLGRGFPNPNVLANYLDQRGSVGNNDVINAVAKRAPEADKDAEAARGVTEAFEGLEAATKRLAEELAGDRGITQAIDTLTHLIDSAASHADQLLHPRDYEPGGPKFIGPVSPAERAEYNKPDILDIGKALVTGNADERFKDSNWIKAAKGLYNGPAGLQKTPAEGVQDMIDAAQQPGAIYQQQQPFVDETNRGVFRDTNPSYNWPTAPEWPQPQQQSQDTTQGGVNVAAAIDASGEKQSSVFERVGAAIVSAITALAQGANPEHLKLEGTDAEAGLGIRGATGGLATPMGFFDDGGHVSGPGTSTSDSIPAMLSNGEYVVKASSVKKAGLGFLDWLNAGHFAEGGPVKVWGHAASGEEYSIVYDPHTGGAYIGGQLFDPKNPDPKIQKYLQDPGVQDAIRRSKEGAGARSSKKDDAKGAPAENAFDIAQSAWSDLASAWADLLPKGSQDQAAAPNDLANKHKHKHKSDFTGRFGHDDNTDTYVADGGLIGHFADGGLVGMMQHLASGGPALDLTDHLDAPGSRPSLDLTSKLSGGGSPWDGLQHLGSMDLRSDHGDARILGRQDVLREISRSANARALVRTGQSPSWRT